MTPQLDSKEHLHDLGYSQIAGDNMSNGRIETLVDGVFAIVLTLLVFDIKAPQAATDAELIRQLLALAPKFFTYVLSFVILGLFWFGHQMVSRYIRRVDRIHIWFNLLFLMCVAFIPFSAALLGENGQQRSAAIVYGVNLLATGLTRYLHWRYVTSNHRLVSNDLDKRLIRAVRRTFLIVPVVYTIAIGVAFLSVPASLAIYTFSPILGAVRMNSVFPHPHHERTQNSR